MLEAWRLGIDWGVRFEVRFEGVFMAFESMYENETGTAVQTIILVLVENDDSRDTSKAGGE